jgi:hypothetical protein
MRPGRLSGWDAVAIIDVLGRAMACHPPLSYHSDISEASLTSTRALQTNAAARWVLACAVGGLAYGALATLNAPLADLALGALLGVPQAVALWRDVRAPALWPLVTCLAMLVAWATGFISVIVVAAFSEPVLRSSPSAWAILFGSLAYGGGTLLGGAVVGLAQACLLSAATAGRRLWLVRTALGALAFWICVLGAFAIFAGGWTGTNAVFGLWHEGATLLLFVLGGTLGGVAYGVITAPVLGRLLAQVAR